MAYESIHAGDYGHTFKLTLQEDSVALDVSGFATKQMVLTSPSGTESVVTASFATDGTDGVLQYTTVSGDIDEAGSWTIQGRVSNASPAARHTSDVVKFTVG